MAAALSLNVPRTQNTAPVLEFNCLYTHDVRRKNKRWQDGFLRYHTFNKRIMLYDLPRHFIGDTHWTAAEALHEGDEVRLDTDGVMVEVADVVGRTETDLTELRKYTNKSSSERGSSPIRGPQTPVVTRHIAATATAPTQLKHRSLNTLLGTPKGPLGKATLPTKSPFETRHWELENEVNKAREQGRPPKRRREDSAPTWSVTRTTTDERPAGTEETPLWARTADEAKQRLKPLLNQGQQHEPEREKFLPELYSEALRPPTPPVSSRSSSPAFQTQKTRSKQSKQSPKPCRFDVREQPRQVSPANREAASPPRRHEIAPSTTGTERPESTKSGSVLCFAVAPKQKKKLICQDQLTSIPKRISSTNTDAAADRLLGAASDGEAEPPKAKTQRQLLEERLNRISTKQKKTDARQAAASEAAELRAVDAECTDSRIREEATARRGGLATSKAQLVALDELARLDQILMKPSELRQDTGTRQFTEHTKPLNAGTKHPRLLKKRGGVGRLDIRESAVSSFKARKPKEPPATAAIVMEEAHQEDAPLDTIEVPPREVRSLRRAISDTNNMPRSQPKRIPGAPMRLTPSPRKQAVNTRPATARPVLTTNGLFAKPTPLRKQDSNDALAATAAPSAPIAAPAASTSPLRQPMKSLHEAVGLNVATGGTSAVIPCRQFQAPEMASEMVQMDVAAKVDPWSREAFDLFKWRPPGWDEERWCFKELADAVKEVAQPN